MRVWIELDEERSGWAQTRMLVAWLTHAGYVAQVLIGPEPKVLAVSGHRLVPAARGALGRAPPGGQRGLPRGAHTSTARFAAIWSAKVTFPT